MADLSLLNKKRYRKRSGAYSVQKKEYQKIANRVIEFAERDRQERVDDFDRRLQRNAKLRQWTTGKDFPWPDSSDAAIPDLTTASLRFQDTLHNSVMSQRPVIVSKAERPEYRMREEKIDNILDHQFFVEQVGEKVVEELAQQFTDEGCFTAFIPWVRENRKWCDIRIYPEIPKEVLPVQYFAQILSQKYPDAQPKRLDEDGWEWELFGLEDTDSVYISFYSYKDRVEMYVDQVMKVYDGPKIIVKDYQDVLYPHRSANLQPPTPSNPGGASHVILVDFPTIDEIERLSSGDEPYYDLLDKDELDKFKNLTQNKSEDEQEYQKDSFQGTSDLTEHTDYKHRRVTRYICFDIYDIDNDKETEDVVWWVIKESKTLLKARKMTEVYPLRPPRRPLSEACCIPVKGRRAGIGIPELGEGLHDLKKTIIDLTIDAGTLQAIPFGFYRPASSIKPDVYRLYPGDMMPLNNPREDVNMPNLSNNAMAFGANMYTIADQMEERLTMIGDLQSGRVPRGKASALRTAEGLQTILGQGEARPERILRRFFMGLVDIYRVMHGLNRNFLAQKKKFRVGGFMDPGQDPYKEVSPEDIDGDYQFGFYANVLNSSKTAMQEALMALTPQIVNPLTFQTGIMTPQKFYRLLADTVKAHGQNPNDYLNSPTPGADGPSLTAEEAIAVIMDSETPFGTPLEGLELHLQKLQLFSQSPEFGLLSQYQVQIFKVYTQQLFMMLQAQLKQQQLLTAAADHQKKSSKDSGQDRSPSGPVDQTSPPVQKNELIDESLPTAQGIQ